MPIMTQEQITLSRVSDGVKGLDGSTTHVNTSPRSWTESLYITIRDRVGSYLFDPITIDTDKKIQNGDIVLIAGTTTDTKKNYVLYVRVDTAEYTSTGLMGTVVSSVEDGRQGIDGAPGEKGDKGDDGKDGSDGASAYQIALANGFAGTEEAWLASLVGKDGEDGNPGQPGEDGKTPYMHIAYATDISGTNFSKTYFDGATHIGTCVDYNSADPSTASLYTWALIKGTDGKDGSEGKSIRQIVNQRLIETTYETAKIWATYKNDTWADITIPEWNVGDTCFLAITIKDRNNEIGYMRCEILGFEGTTLRANNLDFMMGATGAQGAQGDKGDKGDKGEQGPTGASAYQIALANGFTGTEEAWLASLIGKDGEDGNPGQPGADGKTPYMHIAYATSTSGANFSKTYFDGATHIGTCVDYNSADPSTASSYTWALIKGADGKDGSNGADGKDGAQGGGWFRVDTDYAETVTSIPVGKLYPNTIAPQVGDTVVYKSGRIGSITAVSSSAYTITLRSATLQGAAGPTGATGPQGPQGIQGVQGAQGYSIVASVSRPSWVESQWELYGTIGHEEYWSDTTSIRNGCRIGDIFTVVGTANDTGRAHVAYYQSTTSSGELEGRCIAHSIAERGATGAQGSKGDKGDTGSTGATGLTIVRGFGNRYGVGATVTTELQDLNRTPVVGETTSTICAGRYFTIFKVMAVTSTSFTIQSIYEYDIKGATGAQGAAGADGRMLYATCTTDAGTAAKVATLASGSLSLTSGATVSVKFTNANSVASPTLNIAGTGAKPIYLNGAALTNSAYYWVAGATVTFVYDGSYWVVADASALVKANEANSAASNAQASADSVAANLANNYRTKYLPDTRTTNQSPEWYIWNYPLQVIVEFKECGVLGLWDEGYCALETVVPWRDASGGYPKQVAKVLDKEYWRVGTGAYTWSAWRDASATATNFIDYDEVNGLQIGNKQSGSWVGTRTQQTADAFKILDATGDELATYGLNLVELGKKSRDAVIKMCNEAASMYVTKGAGREAFTIKSDNLEIETSSSKYVRDPNTNTTTRACFPHASVRLEDGTNDGSYVDGVQLSINTGHLSQDYTTGDWANYWSGIDLSPKHINMSVAANPTPDNTLVKDIAGIRMDQYGTHITGPLFMNSIPYGPNVLWTNPNPASNFSGQTVTIDGLSLYSTVVIEWRTSVTTAEYTQDTFTCITEGIKYRLIRARKTGEGAIYRTFTVSGNDVIFDAGYSNGTSGNANCIPTRIIGIM